MRTIKFRGKDTQGKWLIGALVPNGKKLLYIAPFGKGFSLEEVFPSSVGQFTGVLDSNGKEIYEGDIVKVTQIRPKYDTPIDRGTRLVTFDPWYGWRLGSDKVRYEIEAMTTLGPIDRIEIIGNRYDNPELNPDNNESTM